MKLLALSLLLILTTVTNFSPQVASADFGLNVPSACRFRGQIVQIAGSKFLCQRKTDRISGLSKSSFTLIKITSNRIQRLPNDRIVAPTSSTTTPQTTTSSTSTSTSTTVLQNKYLLRSTYEVVDANRIMLSWNQIPDVREYRICINNQCNGTSSSIWTTINSSLTSVIVDLPRGQSNQYFVHALLFPHAAQFDLLDTRDCCYGTKWAHSNWLWATNK